MCVYIIIMSNKLNGEHKAGAVEGDCLQVCSGWQTTSKEFLSQDRKAREKQAVQISGLEEAG